MIYSDVMTPDYCVGVLELGRATAAEQMAAGKHLSAVVQPKRVHLVIADFGHEGSIPVYAYKSEEAAEMCAHSLTEYNSLRPKWLGDSDAEYTKWLKQTKRWEKKHPCYSNSYADRFYVMPIDILYAAMAAPIGDRDE